MMAKDKRKSRNQHITNILTLLKESAKDGKIQLSVLIYNPYRLMNTIRNYVDAHPLKNNISYADEGQLTAWLLKGVLRYIFLYMSFEDSQWRYLFGSSVQGETFGSCAYFDILSGEEVKRVLQTLKLLLPPKKSTALEKTKNKIKMEWRYLILYIKDFPISQSAMASDMVKKACNELRLELVDELRFP
jgi:hypothetical protein